MKKRYQSIDNFNKIIVNTHKITNVNSKTAIKVTLSEFEDINV